METPKRRINLVSKKDLEITWFNGGPGAGGQKRNKCQMCCRIYHPESGARAQATEERSQQQNLHKAFERLAKTPQMKFWLAKKLYELNQKETMEETVEKSLTPDNLKYEVKNAEGKWIEVTPEHFESIDAKREVPL